jgi:hypothetical protein
MRSSAQTTPRATIEFRRARGCSAEQPARRRHGGACTVCVARRSPATEADRARVQWSNNGVARLMVSQIGSGRKLLKRAGPKESQRRSRVIPGTRPTARRVIPGVGIDRNPRYKSPPGQPGQRHRGRHKRYQIEARATSGRNGRKLVRLKRLADSHPQLSTAQLSRPVARQDRCTGDFLE